MTGVVIWTLFVAIVAGLLGFLACALLHTAATPHDDDLCDEFEATRRALQMAQREWTGHDPRAADAPIDRWDRYDETPPWAEGDTPDVDRYMESEQFVAGAISTLPPFNHFHPAWALPIARQALDALSEWEPTDG